MSCETFTTEIEGGNYTYTQLSAKKSLKLKFRLAGILGTAVSDILPAIGKSDEEQMKAFGAAIQDVFSKNEPDKVLKLIEDILVPAFKDNERIDIDKHFEGNLPDLYKVIFWILGKEYGNFIEGINAL